VDKTIFTIGHSTRPLVEFFKILGSFHVEMIADVRTIPKSRFNPQFNLEQLQAAARDRGIGYINLPGLGGLRHAQKESINMGWRNPSFRGYADYMQTAEFVLSLEQLMTIANEKTTCVMCAEAVPWRCHRSLIGDALLVRGFKVVDVLSEKNARDHQLTSFAMVKGFNITYPEAPIKTS
jgi:uncharacterized protein (DUF488 family)